MRIVKLSEALDWESNLTPLPNPNLRTLFDCGEPSLNIYLKQLARKSDEENISRPWILIDTKKNAYAGYISLSNTSIEKKPDVQNIHKTNVNPIPALLIGRLAVDLNYKGQGLGEKLPMFGFKKALEVNEISAIQVIAVDALNTSAEKFYEQYGFKKIGATKQMIISVKNLK
jgi:predicted GNAT family N-acyltransferase